MEEFYEELRKLMPLKNWSDLISEEREKQDFREGLSCTLDAYVSLLKKYKAILGPDIDDIIIKVEECNNYLKESVNYYYEGMYSLAYESIAKILSDSLYKASYLPIQPGYVLYKVRTIEKYQKLTFEEMFHIPLNQRGIVKTQRYSAPGYPCLYLGKSINVCREELGRPRFDDLMISRFVVKNEFQVLDLRVPQKDELESDRLAEVLKKIPLIMSVSIVVIDTDASFKPEYIIPQLIIEYIITNNRNEYKEGKHDLFSFILGVYYMSTHVNGELEFPEDIFYNLALPVVVVSGKETYCRLLSSCFDWTDPTSYYYEDIKEKFDSVFRDEDIDSKLSQKEVHYKYSKMGELESRMSKLSLKGHKSIIMNTDVVHLDSDGKMLSNFEIRADHDVKWTIKEVK